MANIISPSFGRASKCVAIILVAIPAAFAQAELPSLPSVCDSERNKALAIYNECISMDKDTESYTECAMEYKEQKSRAEQACHVAPVAAPVAPAAPAARAAAAKMALAWGNS